MALPIHKKKPKKSLRKTKILMNPFFSRILFRTLNHQYDYIYDWTMLKQKNLQVTAANNPPITQEPDPAHYDQKGRPEAKIILPE